MRLLFVCTGNLARSPLAAGLMRVGLADCGIGGVEVEAAGIHAVVDAPATPKALRIAAAYGADLSAHRARQFEREWFARFDHVYALDAMHLEFLRDIRPKDCTGGLSLLPARRGVRGLEVFDPYGRSGRAYARAARLIAEGVGVILADMLERASAARLPGLQRAR